MRCILNKAMRCILFGVLFLVSTQCSSQKYFPFKYKEVPNKFLPSHAELQPHILKFEQLMTQAYDLTHSLPLGYVMDGTVDYTASLQKGINEHNVVVFPSFPVMINWKGLRLNSNNVILFQSTSKVIIQPNDKVGYKGFILKNIQNVSIYFPVLKGERFQHKTTKGQWGIGIYIIGSSSIYIINPHISEFWGDGIYIGNAEKASRDIKVYYAVLDNNRRNGISIISASDVLIESPLISNTNGTNPASGIDIEPDNNIGEINEIKINNPVTYNSQKYGIIVSLERLRGKLKKNINIEINNPKDFYSIGGFLMTNRKKGYENKSKLTGSIIINHPQWNAKAAKIPKIDSYTPNVIINNSNE